MIQKNNEFNLIKLFKYKIKLTLTILIHLMDV